MIRYFLKKISLGLVTLFGVVSLVFVLFTVLPGDPARMMLDKNEDQQQMQLIKKKFGFDKPLIVQYFYFINDLLPISIHSTDLKDYTFLDQRKYQPVLTLNCLDYKIAFKSPYLRESYTRSGKKVSQIIADTLPNTIVLAVSSILIAIVLGISLGILSAINKDTLLDRFLVVFSTFGMSVPSFLSAILFAWVFGFLWHQYTGLDMNGSLYEVDDFGSGSYLALKNLILPAIVLGIRPVGVIVQLTRSALLEELSKAYILTAKAKGLSRFNIIWKHALKNALNPVVTAISGWFASMLAGAVFVEFIFGWNGLGKEIITAINTKDLPVLMAGVLVISTSFILINIFVDVIYALLDPKVKLS